MNNVFRKVSTVLLVIVLITGDIIGMNSNSVKADTVLTSPLISIVGYQIKTNVTTDEKVSFRTVCKAPDKGSVITVNEKNYIVENLGTIYVKDPNRSGNHSNIVLSKSYTLLDSVPCVEYGIEDQAFKYIGKSMYRGTYLTFGYIATENGIIEKKNGYTSYIRTLTNMDSFVLNSLLVRAFVEAVDEDGNNVIIYGESASKTSVAHIAGETYKKGAAPNKEGHEYLYDSILHTLPTSHPYYMNEPLEYGWAGVIS